MCFDLSLEMGLTARRFALLLSPHTVGFFAVIFKSVHNCLIHISSFAALLIAISVIIQSPQARKPLDRMCVHAGDGQTYLVGVDTMS